MSHVLRCMKGMLATPAASKCLILECGYSTLPINPSNALYQCPLYRLSSSEYRWIWPHLRTRLKWLISANLVKPLRLICSNFVSNSLKSYFSSCPTTTKKEKEVSKSHWSLALSDNLLKQRQPQSPLTNSKLNEPVFKMECRASYHIL